MADNQPKVAQPTQQSKDASNRGANVKAQANKDAAATPKVDTKTKRERFVELAPKRTRGVLKALEVLSNCSNKSGYEYTPEDLEKIFGAIEKKIKTVKDKFSGTVEKGTEFSL